MISEGPFFKDKFVVCFSWWSFRNQTLEGMEIEGGFFYLEDNIRLIYSLIALYNQLMEKDIQQKVVLD